MQWILKDPIRWGTDVLWEPHVWKVSTFHKPIFIWNKLDNKYFDLNIKSTSYLVWHTLQVFGKHKSSR